MKSDVLVCGEALIDMFSDSSDSHHIQMNCRPGGAPANVAAGLSKLGLSPAFWTSVGRDDFGDIIVRRLAQMGVSDSLINVRSDAPTTLAVVHEDSRKRDFSLYIDETAATKIESDQVPENIFNEINWVHFGGVLLSQPSAKQSIFELVAAARDRGCTVSFDPNTRTTLWSESDLEAAMTRAFELSDVIKASLSDITPFIDTERDIRDVIKEISSNGPETVFLTQGTEGAYGAKKADGNLEIEHHPGFEIDTVDTTGAGDAFVSSVIYQMVHRDRPIEEILQFANASAALSITSEGAMSSLPDSDEVAEFVGSQS